MKDLSPHVMKQPPQVVEATTRVLPGIEEIHLWDYWLVVKRHCWLIAATFLAAVLMAGLSTYSQPPIYSAETSLLIERQAPQVLGLQGAMPDYHEWDEYDYYRTQYEILKSHSLAARVVRELDLANDPAFTRSDVQPGLIAGAWAKLKTVWTGKPVQAQVPLPRFLQETQANDQNVDEVSINQGLIGAYASMMQIQPVRRTRLVRIAFHTPDPELSSRLANAHANAYIRQGVQIRTQASGDAEKFLEEKLVELKERLEKSEAALGVYRRDKQIVSLDAAENMVVQRLSDLNKRLTEAEGERIALEAQVHLIRKRAYDSLPPVLESALIQTLKDQVAKLDAEYARLSSQFKTGYPRLVEVEAQFKGLQRRLNGEIARVVQGLESSYLAAERQESELRRTMEQQKVSTLELKDASVQYAILEREADTNRQLYDNVLQRMKEMGVVAELRTSNVFTIDKARTPFGPSGPQRRRSIMLAAIVGLLGGVGFAFFFEYLDNTFKTPEELERALHLPNLGLVPDFQQSSDQLPDYSPIPLSHSPTEHGNSSPEAKKETSAPWMASLHTEVTAVRPDLVLSHHPFSALTEAYRSLRTALLLSRAGDAPRTILFTSGSQAEGKTTTVGNMSILFAQMGVKVLLIDADLRLPDCHKLFGLENGPGLTECLTTRQNRHKLIHPTAVKNLFLMRSGALPPNPTELIGSQRMNDVLTKLRKHFDYILIDAPPVIPVSDALLLATMVDGVVLVVGGRDTPKRVVKQAYARLGGVATKILGTVLNGVNVRSEYYSDYYSHSSAYFQPVSEERPIFETVAS